MDDYGPIIQWHSKNPVKGLTTHTHTHTPVTRTVTALENRDSNLESSVAEADSEALEGGEFSVEPVMGSMPKPPQEDDRIKVVQNTTGTLECNESDAGGRTSTGGENEPIAEDVTEALMILGKVRVGDKKENSYKEIPSEIFGWSAKIPVVGYTTVAPGGHENARAGDQKENSSQEIPSGNSRDETIYTNTDTTDKQHTDINTNYTHTHNIDKRNRQFLYPIKRPKSSNYETRNPKSSDYETKNPKSSDYETGNPKSSDTRQETLRAQITRQETLRAQIMRQETLRAQITR